MEELNCNSGTTYWVEQILMYTVGYQNQRPWWVHVKLVESSSFWLGFQNLEIPEQPHLGGWVGWNRHKHCTFFYLRTDKATPAEWFIKGGIIAALVCSYLLST